MPMLRIACFSLMALMAVSLIWPGFVHAEVAAPHEIAGFRLQNHIDQYGDRIDKKSAISVRDMAYLEEVDVMAPAGFKSGYLVYGKCAHPGHIVKVSMKYADSSKDFFDKLLDRFKKKYGDPAEWRGDPFHVYVAWKWSFVDRDNRRISMILQHYSGDEDVYKNGNSVKLSMYELIEQEQACYAKKHPQAQTPSVEQPQVPGKVDIDDLVPIP
ncbi:hypothetical protein [Desulfoferrobacter suflitae]|uniref:hypothetical protein n=1 Tax=Desulfoferrobacter suflitae TaxID=2865782 RepID=UPI00216432DC|nr:hypothetical protein [Desulfoferrobacter suflitae]MCK8602775.1 hypothetical protein [Desulfoferrobacter suflitae]